MPCPYFEPRQIVTDGQRSGGRLPLVDEYDGFCHANREARPAPSAVRFSGCNHGHADSGCAVFPAGESRRNRRFNIREKTGETLEILLLETEDHTPVRSAYVLYSKTDERLEPEAFGVCERAQVLALCRSYLRRRESASNGRTEVHDKH